MACELKGLWSRSLNIRIVGKQAFCRSVILHALISLILVSSPMSRAAAEASNKAALIMLYQENYRKCPESPYISTSQKYSLIKLSYLDPLVLTADTPFCQRILLEVLWDEVRIQIKTPLRNDYRKLSSIYLLRDLNLFDIHTVRNHLIIKHIFRINAVLEVKVL